MAQVVVLGDLAVQNEYEALRSLAHGREEGCVGAVPVANARAEFRVA
jgi:hypothetical protein